MVRDAEIAWGTDAATNAPPLGEFAWSSGPRAEAHYRRLLVNGPRWASTFFGEGLGTIAPGAPADLVLVDYRPATEFSSRTLVEHVFAGLLRAPVTGVMISGEIVLDEGRLTRADEREVAERGRECAKRVWAHMG
jgi:cytosine/adenosine deaminase-related metal-dependent hydrolase